MRRGLLLVSAEDEFAPVWGAKPFFVPDSPTAATDALLLLHSSWVQAAGGKLADPVTGVVEVSPLVSYGGEGLEPLVAGREFTEAYDLDLQGYAPPSVRKVLGPATAVMAPMVAAWLGLAVTKAAMAVVKLRN
ncbi:uncharacterized protein HaLaN_03179 [Haematococcus lacustris]|uniref:Uncharacterized protein n=1 Tax=Haematococcus lacustris TaxID=44745 RepID=A0A699YDS2_HAELA|nr:uncharacterized protein HaLaN_03179 [Haematococcus lacustris]